MGRRRRAGRQGRAVRQPDRKDWRVLGIVHLADTREQAIDDCTYGLQDFADYFGAAGFVPLNNEVEGAQTPRTSSSKTMPPRAIAASARRPTRSPTSRICLTAPAASARS